MSIFAKLFSGVERAEAVSIPSILKLSILLLWLGVMAAIFLNRNRLKTMRKPFSLAKIGAMVLLVDQIVLYSWQVFSGYFNFEMSLPLYHCRIAVPLLILDLIFGVKILRSIWIYWGALGSVFAMAFMDLYKFDFPHYTNFQFFIVHLLLGWIICYVIFVLDYRFEKKGLKFALIVTFIYNVGLILFNALCNGTFIASEGLKFNYGYMVLAPPPLTKLALTFPPFVYYAIMLVGYELMILLLYAVGRGLNKMSDRKRHVERKELSA